MKITLTQLREHNACEEETNLFERTFGREVEVTEDLCVKYAQEFSFDWAAGNLLNPEQRGIYREARDPAWKIYYEATDSAWEIYREAKDSARRIYREATDSASRIYYEATDSAHRIYREATDSALRIYYEATDSALRIYREACARAFARAYNTPEPEHKKE